MTAIEVLELFSSNLHIHKNIESLYYDMYSMITVYEVDNPGLDEEEYDNFVSAILVLVVKRLKQLNFNNSEEELVRHLLHTIETHRKPSS